MSILPPIENDDQLDATHEDEALCVSALTAVAHERGLTGPVEFFEDGSAIVGASGDTVIKIFAPYDVQLAESEARVLSHIDEQLPCPTPRLIDRSELDGWPVVIMTRLAGQPSSRAWDELGPDDRTRLAADMGHTAAALHALPTDPVADLPPNWETFVAEGATRCRQRQIQFKLESSWIDQIEPFLRSVERPDQPSVLLHTELMREHFLVDRIAGEWKLTGLLDFEPSMIGHREYEFSSVGLFIAKGDPAILRAFMNAYGYGDQNLDPEFRRRCMAYTLLHRYACLPWYFRFMPSEGATTFDDLAERWWATA